MKRILVPTNCEETSGRAFRLATELSRKNNARVYVLRVIKTHGGAYFTKDGEIVSDMASDVQKYKDEKAQAEHVLSTWAKRINPDAYQIIKYGGVADTILEMANKYKVNMIIMGNRFVDKSRTTFFGDLTTFLIKKAKVPILSVKNDLTADGLNNIVFANEFDGKLSFYDALQDMQQFCDSNVDFLRVKTNESVEDEDIKKNMEYFARVNMIKDFSMNIHESNKVEPGILDWIAANKCDLLAVKNVTKAGGSPLFRPKLRKEFLLKAPISTLIYND